MHLHNIIVNTDNKTWVVSLMLFFINCYRYLCVDYLLVDVSFISSRRWKKYDLVLYLLAIKENQEVKC